MFKIQTYNKISDKGLSLLTRDMYTVSSDTHQPDAILLRSQSLHELELPPSLKAIARAGAGVNNIPVDKMTEAGIPVFNTPGANANAVKELVICSLLMANRNLCPGWQDTKNLHGDDVPEQVEQLKKQFTGSELPGNTLGVIGLGAIGVKVANAALKLDLNVIAYDPHITIKNAWQLSSSVTQASSMQEVLRNADYVTIHVPYMQATHHLINKEMLDLMKSSALLLNFSRADIVESDAVIDALNNQQLRQYVTDFPNQKLIQTNNVLCLPHLGASTVEAEENCAVMAANTLKRFLETGEIENSVNFPSINMPYQGGERVAIVNSNVPNMLGQISSAIADFGLNIKDMINRSRNNIAYTLIDIEQKIDDEVLSKLSAINGVIHCRLITIKD
jgi:D-3-phosphoglycerate dehydrogenase